MSNSRAIRLTHVEHTFEPVFDINSKVLILGTLPSVKSRENNFYYGHTRNRFWKVLSHILEAPLPETVIQKKELLLDSGIAIWDVVKSCDIHASSDSSITNVEPADINIILREADIRAIYANGAAAYNLYNKYCLPDTGREIIKLPSTSPANAAYSLDRLTEQWKTIKDMLL